MLTSIADHTFYLGLWDLEPPYRFRWDVGFRKQFAVMGIWLAFTAFDSWYWWVGVWKMKPSNGPIGTVIFFPYVGNTPLFGPDEWISILAKVVNVLITLFLVTSLTTLCGNKLQQTRLDKLITSERFRRLTMRWRKAMGVELDEASASQDKPSPTSVELRQPLTEQHSNGERSSPEKSGSTEHVTSSTTQDEKQHFSRAASHADSDSPPSYRSLSRTATGLLKRGLWRRTSTNKDFDLTQNPPDYILYEPTFQSLNTAYDFLKATSTYPKPGKMEPFPGYTTLRIIFFPTTWIADLFYYFLIQMFHPLRPGVLLAVKSHASTCRFSCAMSYPQILRLAIRHPSYRTINTPDLILASRIILSTEPSARPSRVWRFFLGYGMLGACSVLIIGTELTIQWNKIQGVQNVSSVGQLVPFTLGVGSLAKILCSAVAKRGKGVEEFCYYDRCVETGRREKRVWEEGSKNFLQCREELGKHKERQGEDQGAGIGEEKC
jgi:hypothetical protein